MALIRRWYPSPNYSSGGKKRLLVLHTTEGFTGNNGMIDCAVYFQGNVGASSQVVIDNFHPGSIAECVKSNNGAWTQCNYNSVSVSAEQCGYASWSRDVWLNDKESLLRNTAQWLAEESGRFGIPLTKLSPSQAQGNSAGVCYHSDLGSSGCGHSDPGNGYPIDIVLQWAQGDTPSTPSPPLAIEEDEMPTLALRPPGSPEIPLEICLNGPYSDLGFISDASVLSGPIKIRVALHVVNGPWEVHNVTIDSTHDRPVVRANNGKKYDGVSLRRQDFIASDIVPVFVK